MRSQFHFMLSDKPNQIVKVMHKISNDSQFRGDAKSLENFEEHKHFFPDLC